MNVLDMDPVTADAIYKPLSSRAIRLIRLHAAAQPTDPITVDMFATPGDAIPTYSMHIVDLSRPPPTYTHLTFGPEPEIPVYDAISYVWGNPRNTMQIICNGFLVNITANLHAALLQVRALSNAPRVIWADALCINQQDMNERSQQVAMMGDIYAFARVVFACMGASPDGRGWELSSLLQNWHDSKRESIGASPVGYLQSLGLLLRNPWFERTWMIQEVGLAKEPMILYDDIQISYRELMQLMSVLVQDEAERGAEMGVHPLLVHRWWQDWLASSYSPHPSEASHNILELLDHARPLSCQDRRDRIYGFLGHPLARIMRPGIVPDYRKDAIQVFREVSESFLLTAGMRTLSSVVHNEETIEDYTIPSWVVRWDVHSVLTRVHTRSGVPLPACGNRATTQMAQIGDVLYIRGVRTDTVHNVFLIDGLDHFGSLTFTSKATGRQCTLEELLLYLGSGPTCPYVSIHLAHCLGFSALRGEKISIIEKIWDMVRIKCQGGLLPETNQDVSATHKWWAYMREQCTGRAFFITEKGYYGVGARTARQGDVCCVFDGAFAPFVLRPVPANVNAQQVDYRYRLVGEAFIHGIMEGEAVRVPEAKEEIFQIV